MAIEPDLSYSWLPPSSSTPSPMEEVDLCTFPAPTDLISNPCAPKAIKSSSHIITSNSHNNMSPLDTIQLQEETFILTPVTQPFQIQLCVNEDYDAEGEMALQSQPYSLPEAETLPFSHLQEPLHDPMLPVDSKNLEIAKSTPGYPAKSGGHSYIGSHFSPVSVHSLADSGVSSISENASERLLSNAPPTPNYLDIDFDQIVEDVDDMFRERYEALEKQKADDEDSAKTSDLIKRNMPPEYFFTYTSKNPEELAHDLAKSLVDKALESDRRKYLEKDPSVNVEDIYENWAEVSGNRAMEAMLDDLIGSAVNEITTSIYHVYSGDFFKFKEAASSSHGGKFVSPSEALQDELDVLVSDVLAESDENCLVSKKFGLYQISGPSRIYDFRVPLSRQKVEEKAFMTRWKGYTSHICTDECNRNRRIFITAKMRREAERKRRNRAGILLSSLKKKVYHCRCIDCRQERKNNGVPEPSDSIEVKELEVPENIFPKEGIPILKKQGRGRPRKYPRVEDFHRWFIEQENNKNGILPEVPKNGNEKDQSSSNSKTNISFPSDASEGIVGIDNMVKKRPRGRPPKYQVSLQPDKSDNLKIKLSRKRPSRSTYSKVNYLDCDSSDEGYSESVKDVAQDDKVSHRSYKRPAKRKRLTRTSNKALSPSSFDKVWPSPSPENVYECLESAIKTVSLKSDTKDDSVIPQNPKLSISIKDSEILANRLNESYSLLQENTVPLKPISEVASNKTIKESDFPIVNIETISGTKDNTEDSIEVVAFPPTPESLPPLLSHPTTSPHLQKISDSPIRNDTSPQYIIIQEVNKVFKPRMSDTGIQTNGNVVNLCSNMSFGLQPPKPCSLFVSKSIQTNISLETGPADVSSIGKTLSTQSISTSTDISVCTNTNELLQTKHLTHEEEVKEDVREESKEQEVPNWTLHPSQDQKTISCKPLISTDLSLPKEKGFTSAEDHLLSSLANYTSIDDNHGDLKGFNKMATIKTYSRKVHISSPVNHSAPKVNLSESSILRCCSSDSDKLECLLASPFDIVPLTSELVNLNFHEEFSSLLDESLIKSLSVNEALTQDDEDDDGAFRVHRSMLFTSSPEVMESKKVHPTKRIPKVIIKKLSPEVIDSWCNRVSLLVHSSSNRHLSQHQEIQGNVRWDHQREQCHDSFFNDEIDLIQRKSRRKKNLKRKGNALPLVENVNDAVVPHVLDKDLLQASKPLPVYVLIEQQYKKN